jgi:hypothetical protein
MKATLRLAVVLLALCAMGLRAGLPQGWMPDSAGAGLVICSVDGAKHRAPVQGPQQHGQDGHVTACPFAGLAPLAATAFADSVSPPQTVAFADNWSAQTPSVFRQQPLAHRARAPPRYV